MKKIMLKIFFKEGFLKQNNFQISYYKEGCANINFLEEDRELIYYIRDMNEFSEIIGYFNLDEIESITFN